MGTLAYPLAHHRARADREMAPGADLALRSSGYAALCLAAVLALIFVDGTAPSVVLATAFALCGALLVQRSNRERRGSGLITVFFWLAAAHAIFGYWTAGNSVDGIWIGTDAGRMFQRSFYVIAATLLAAACTYDLSLRRPPKWTAKFGRLRVSSGRLDWTARGFMALGALLVVYVFASAGFFPILASNPGTARYLSDDLIDSFRWYEWVLDKGLALLGCSIPVLLVSGLISRRRWDGLLGGVGVLAVFLTLSRGPLISLLVVSLLTVGLLRDKFPWKYLLFLVPVVGGYFASQLVFLHSEGATAILSGLPEVRDLGWVMSLAGDDRMLGATYLGPLIPLPSYLSGSSYGWGNLNEVLIHMIGLGEGQIGGLRITACGEGYLNFGPVGILVVGMVLGYLCSCLSHLEGVVRQIRNQALSYVFASLFVWVCFWFYLAGTGAAGTIKHLLVFVGIMIYLSRARPAKAARR